MRNVTTTKAMDGSVTPIQRLSHVDKHLPGFDGDNGGVAIRVLAPFESKFGGQPALHNYGSAPSKNTNGNSLLLRLDYKRSRILLTGDLNSYSQRARPSPITPGNASSFNATWLKRAIMAATTSPY